MKTEEGRNKREVSVRGGVRGTEGESEMKMPECIRRGGVDF
jgi:hypothetical protein